MSTPMRFGQADWDRIRQDWTAWWNHDLDRPLVVIERLDGYDLAPELIPEVVKHVIQFPLSTPAKVVIDFYSRIIENTHYHGDAFPRWFPDFGPGFMAAFLGAKVSVQPNTVWLEPEQVHPIAELTLRYQADNAWWKWVQEVTRIGVERWGDQVTVGYVDLGGNFDILASLHTVNQLLQELYDAPEELERLVGETNRLWLHYFDQLDAIIRPAGAGATPWAQMWAPGRFYMLQSDFSYMISPKMFERFVLPDIATCSQALDHAFYHLDGTGQIRHLDRLLALKSLDGIQWIPGAGAPPAEEWLPVLQRIRAAGKLCQVYVTPQGARTILQELGGKGFCFVILEDLENEDINDFLKTMSYEQL